MSTSIRVPLAFFGPPISGTCHKRPFCRKYAKLWLVAQAATPMHERSHWERKFGIEVGQLATTTGQLLKTFDWSRGKVTRFIGEIEGGGFADTEVRGVGRASAYVITITDFAEKYLFRDTPQVGHGTASGYANGHTPDLFGAR